MNYQIDLCKSANQKQLLTMKLSGLKSLFKANGEQNSYADLVTTVKVNRYVEDVAQPEQEFQVVAYVDKEYGIHLLLDAIDIGATAGGDAAAMKNTYSMHRFDVDTLFSATEDRNVYGNVRAEGARYKPSAWKRSNTENLYFAKEQTPDAGKSNKKYDIANARHLYNIRYAEAKSKNETIAYTQTKTFSWTDVFTGTVGSEVFQSGKEIAETVDGKRTAFPAIPALGANHVFAANPKTNKIQNLVLRGSGTGLGLFAQNNGTIRDATLENILVEGGSSTGTFCGVNTGTLSALTTIGGTVSGNVDVGGIVGKDARKTDTVYADLKNDCDVKGYRYVGGIIGQITDEAGQSVSVSGCTNTGLVMGEIYKPNSPTQALEDAITGGLLGEGTTTSATEAQIHKDKNMYNLFKKQNGGEYPYLNSFDREMLQELLQKKLVASLNGRPKDSIEKQVDDFMNTHNWVPCALRDPNGQITSEDVPDSKLTIVLMAKLVGNPESTQIAPIVFHAGKYYYKKHSYTNNLTPGSITNQEDSIDCFTPMGKDKEWHELDFTPGGVTAAAASAPEILALGNDGATTLENEPSYIGGITGRAE
ncbi:MAG: hypothetical protein RSC76_00330, partial [Oscillospiraceae bacterium]